MQPWRLLLTRIDSDKQITGHVLAGEFPRDTALTVLPTGETLPPVTLLSTSAHQTDEQQLQLNATPNSPLQVGQVLCPANNRPEVADQFLAEIQWQAATPLLPGRQYELRASTGTVSASISRLKYRLDGEQQAAASELCQGESGAANLSLSQALVYDPVAVCEALSAFTLHDQESGALLGSGHIQHGLRRASNVHWQALAVDKRSRAELKQQAPKLIWLTGLSGSGKSTIANLLEKKLLASGYHSYLLDGDNVRHGLNRDLGFTAADRVENIRRVAETAKLMLDAGLIVITSFISPFRAERDMARQLIGSDEFLEVHVATPLAVCEQRDPKGLYGKARRGEIKNFTGLDSPYEPPLAADLVINTEVVSPEAAAEELFALLNPGAMLNS